MFKDYLLHIAKSNFPPRAPKKEVLTINTKSSRVLRKQHLWYITIKRFFSPSSFKLKLFPLSPELTIVTPSPFLHPNRSPNYPGFGDRMKHNYDPSFNIKRSKKRKEKMLFTHCKSTPKGFFFLFSLFLFFFFFPAFSSC